jgi:endonuclease/exonuclease/phosphatase family metal-dependent hydrolase
MASNIESLKLSILKITLLLLTVVQCRADVALDLVSFNIRYLNGGDKGVRHWDIRKDLSLEAMRHFEADIIGVQEVLKVQLDFLTAGLPEYAMAGVGRDDGKTRGEYAGIFFKKERFELKDTGTFWLSDTPEEAGSRTWGNEVVRICTWARLVEKSSGRGFTIFNTHFDHAVQPARERSAQLIVERITARAHADEPFVLMGDFNVQEHNPVARYLKGEPVELAGATAISPLPLIDTFRLLHADDPNALTLHDWSGRREGSKIDYLFIDPATGIEVREAWIDDFHKGENYPSDHFPVRARILLK